MIVHDLDIPSVAVLEAEADTPLVIDPNAVCSPSFSLQGFQVVSRRGLEVLQDLCAVQIVQLADSGLAQRLGESLVFSRNVESLGFLVGKADDHKALYNTQRYTVKPYLREVTIGAQDLL